MRTDAHPTSLVLTLSTLTLLSACGDPGPALTPCERSVMPTCDITNPACQASIDDHVACVRGTEPSAPTAFEVLSEQEYAELYPPSSDPYSPAARRCLSLLFLAQWQPPEAPPFTPASIYDFERRKVVVVDRNDDQRIARTVALAQRDAELGGATEFLARTSENFEQHSAGLALLFGEARFFGDAAWFKTKPSPDDELREQTADNIYYGDELLDFHLAAATLDVELPTLNALFVAFGAEFVRNAWIDGDEAKLAEMFTDKVRHVTDLIPDVPRKAALPPLTTLSELPPGYELTTVDSLGAWAWYALRERIDPLPDDATSEQRAERLREVATLWSGDRLDCLYDSANDKAIALWSIALDPASEPFTLPIDKLQGYWKSVENKNIRVIAVGQDGVATDLALLELEWP